MTPTQTRDIRTAITRLFSAYEAHCLAPDDSSLFYTLTSLHSLNDRLSGATTIDLHEFTEFVALKALRNLTHHQEEVRANVRVARAPAQSDLIFLCLVRRDQVERAIQATKPEKWREPTRKACESVFHWYGPAVNINPALFNLMARIYGRLEAETLVPEDEALAFFAESWERENASQMSHFIDGRLFGRAADISAMLAALVADLPEA